ncbi:MAG: hypothetical protein EXR75_16835 [Myxococcales bacterium]|nr:hypothetical protein [Myxococcales bacterium]
MPSKRACCSPSATSRATPSRRGPSRKASSSCTRGSTTSIPSRSRSTSPTRPGSPPRGKPLRVIDGSDSRPDALREPRPDSLRHSRPDSSPDSHPDSRWCAGRRDPGSVAGVMHRMRAFGSGLLVLVAAAVAGCSEEASSGGGSGAGVSSGGGGGGAGPVGPVGPISGEVKRYDVAFDLTTMALRSTLSIDVAEPGGDCFDIDCALEVSDVTLNGNPAGSAEVLDGKLSACGTGSKAGALTLAAHAFVPEGTAGGLDVGFSRSKNLAGGSFAYLLSWVGGCDRFGPCDDDPSKLVEFGFNITHAPGNVVLCPGALVPGSTNTTCELSGTLAPTYSAYALAADPDWVRTPFVKAAGTDLVFYEVPGGKLRATLDASAVGTMLEWLTTTLGPMPYGPELRVAGAPTAWFGFEHPANILLREDLPNYDGDPYANTTMHVLVHEVVHQWAGDRSTLASEADFVWKEAIAEYLTYVFEDEHGAPGDAAASLAYWDEIALGADYHPRPMDQPTPPLAKFYGDVYGPGPMVLFVQLESMFGRPAILAAIAAFLAEPGSRSVEELRAALELATKVELKAYFDAWVFGTGKPEWPTVGVETSQLGTEVTVTVTQSTPSKKLHGCLVEVDVVGASKTATALVDFGVTPTEAKKSVTVSLDEPIVKVVIDPRNRLVSWHAATATQERARPRRKAIPF